MKINILLIILLFLTFFASAQNEKGRFFVETGIKLLGSGEYQDFIGKTGFSYYKLKWETVNDNGTYYQEGYYNNFSWAVAPRLGYCVSNQIKTGFEFQFYKCNSTSETKYNNWTSGLFFRLNFNDNKISPFIELSSGLGHSKMEEESTFNNGVVHIITEEQKLFYYSGSAGVAFIMTANLNLNLSAKLQNTLGDVIDNDTEWSMSYVNEKYKYLEIIPMFSITYIFKGKTKTQE